MIIRSCNATLRPSVALMRRDSPANGAVMHVELVSNSSKLRAIFEWLYEAYGPQHWWPGDTPFEVMISAILTQNTAWSNVEKAMANLKAIDCLSPEAVLALSYESLAGLLLPTGYFNVKARRLQGFCGWYLAQGDYKTLAREEAEASAIPQRARH